MIETRACPTGKRRYPNHATAKSVLAAAKRRKHAGLMAPVRFYRCARCEGYHLSSTKEGRL